MLGLASLNRGERKPHSRNVASSSQLEICMVFQHLSIYIKSVFHASVCLRCAPSPPTQGVMSLTYSQTHRRGENEAGASGTTTDTVPLTGTTLDWGEVVQLRRMRV